MDDLNKKNLRDYNKLSTEEKNKYYLEYLFESTESKCRLEDDYMLIRLRTDESIKKAFKFSLVVSFIIYSIIFALFLGLLLSDSNRNLSNIYPGFFGSIFAILLFFTLIYSFLKINSNKDILLDRRNDSIFSIKNRRKKRIYLGRLSSIIDIFYKDYYGEYGYNGTYIKFRLSNSRVIKVCLYFKDANNSVFNYFKTAFVAWFNKSTEFFLAPKNNDEYLEYIYNYSLSSAKYLDNSKTHKIQLFSNEYKKNLLNKLRNAFIIFISIFVFLLLVGGNMTNIIKIFLSILFVLGLIIFYILLLNILKKSKSEVYIDEKNKEIRLNGMFNEKIVIPFSLINSIEKLDRQNKGKYILPSKIVISDKNGKIYPIAYYFKRPDYDFFYEFVNIHLNENIFNQKY